MKTPAEKLLDSVEWVAIPGADKPTETDLPHVTHSGYFHIGDAKILCHQLSNGQRVLDADSVHALFSAATETAASAIDDGEITE